MKKEFRDLIITSERKEIFQVINIFDNLFTSKDVQIQMQERGLKVRIATVQNLLRGLCYRGYLEQFPIKISPTKGRSTLHFKRASGTYQ